MATRAKKRTSLLAKVPWESSDDEAITEAIDRLIAAGADPDETCAESGERPILMACSSGAGIRELAEAGAKLDIVGPCTRWQSLGVIAAAILGDGHAGADVVASLIAAGAPVDHPDRTTDMTPLMAALHDDDTRTADILLRAGADPTRRGDDGSTILHAAGGADAVAWAIAHGGDPSAVADDGSTPLHVACASRSSSRTRVVTALVAAGAKPDTRNKIGARPIDHLLGNDDVAEIAAALMSGGADPASMPWTRIWNDLVERADGDVLPDQKRVGSLLDVSSDAVGGGHGPSPGCVAGCIRVLFDARTTVRRHGPADEAWLSGVMADGVGKRWHLRLLAAAGG